MGTTTTPNKALVMPDDVGEPAPNWTDQWQANAAKLDKGINKVTRQVFTATGTWNKPAGLMFAEVEVQAASGSGGGVATTVAGQSAEGGGGGGGEYARGVFAAATLGASEAVTIGAPGAAAAAGVAGNAGAASSFGAHVTCNGGAAGALGTAGAGSQHALGGAGGSGGTGGDFRISGDDGGPGLSMNGADSAPFPQRSCFGGGSHLGAIATPPATPSTGRIGRDWGGGSTGAGRFGAGAALGSTIGGDAIIVVTQYISDAG